MTKYSLILARNFNFDLKFYMWNYKIAMATFRTSHCQDGDEDALENLNTWKRTSRRIQTGILSKKSKIYTLKFSVRGVLDR